MSTIRIKQILDVNTEYCDLIGIIGEKICTLHIALLNPIGKSLIDNSFVNYWCKKHVNNSASAGLFHFMKGAIMKVKVLKLGESAKEVELQEGATVEHVIQASGFNRQHQTVSVNGHPTFDTSPVQVTPFTLITGN